MVNQFDMWGQNRGRTQSVVKDKPKKASATSQSMLQKYIPALARGGRSGPDTLAGQRDAWGNAMSQMQSVNATNPLLAGAQTLGMGLAGYGIGKANRESEAGTAEYRARLAKALNGGSNEELMSLANDPYADSQSSALALKMWERNNPTPDQLLQRQAAEMQLKGSKFDYDQATMKADRDEQLRLGKQSAVGKFENDFTAQGGDLFSPEMQMGLRERGIEGVNPMDTLKYDQVKPYIDARDYETAFDTMVTPLDKGDFIESNGSIYNTRTGQWTENPNGSGLTDDIKEWNQNNRDRAARGEQPLPFEAYMTTMKKAGASNMTVDMKGQNAYALERGKGFATMAGEIDNSSRSANSMLNTMDTMANAMNNPNFYSGPMAEQVKAFRQVIVAMGGDPNLVSSMETFGAQASKMALDKMGGSLGAGFSNADRDFIRSQVMSLDYTPAGNAALMEINRRIARREIEMANLMRRYEAEKGQVDAGFMQVMSDYAEQNPLFANVKPTATPRAPREMSDDELGSVLSSPIGEN